MLTFAAHAAAAAWKANARLNILRALANTSFGHDKECLTSTYKALVRPFFDYAAPVVYPNYSDLSIHRLQLVQNKALQSVTGLLSASCIGHLQAKTEILPVVDHLRLLSSQYLARALQPSHPSHEAVCRQPRPGHRQMKFTLQSKVGEVVEPFLQNGVIPAGEYRETLKKVHTKIVADSILNAPANRVLKAPPPRIHSSETSLPRLTRVALSQLCSGHSSRLNDYLH